MTLPDKRPPHRPTILTEQLEDTLIAALLATPIKKRAAEHAGITERSWHGWEAKGLADLHTIATARGCEPEDITLDNLPFNESPHAHFFLRVRKARADYLLDALGNIKRAGMGETVTITKTTLRPDKDGNIIKTVETTERVEKSWTALAWLVERQYDEYQLNQRMELTGRGGGPVEISPVSPAERLRERLDNLTEREDGREGLMAELEAASAAPVEDTEASGLDILEPPSPEPPSPAG